MCKNPIRVAVYARISTDREDQVNSLISQKKFFTDYIQQHDGWTLSNVYYDEGVSGTQTKHRIGFNQMIEDATHGNFDLILTKEVSRFARNTVDTLSYTRKLKNANVGVIFTIDNIDTRDCDGELRLTIIASMAQEESRKTSERIKWGQKRRMEQGIVFGRDLLGYTVKQGILSICQEEAPIVQTIFHKYTNEGKGAHTIARELAAKQLYSKHISQWSNTVILRILRNEKYVGDLCQKKTYTPNYLTHAKKVNRNAEEKIYLYNHHEPIIDRSLWNRTQEELDRRAPNRNTNSKYSNRYWCSGKLRCGECGCQFVSRTKKLSNGIYKAWRCYQASNSETYKIDDVHKTCCNKNIINEKALLACMKHCIHLLCDSPIELKEEITSLIKSICNIPQNAHHKNKIQSQISNVEEKKSKSFDALLDGLITKEEFQKQTTRYPI